MALRHQLDCEQLRGAVLDVHVGPTGRVSDVTGPRRPDLSGLVLACSSMLWHIALTSKDPGLKSVHSWSHRPAGTKGTGSLADDLVEHGKRDLIVSAIPPG
jgi:hypothetical protein